MFFIQTSQPFQSHSQSQPSQHPHPHLSSTQTIHQDNDDPRLTIPNQLFKNLVNPFKFTKSNPIYIIALFYLFTIQSVDAFSLEYQQLYTRQVSNSSSSNQYSHHGIGFDIQAVLIPILVCLSGVFAGLTLGYMSLDSTQLCVLAKSGTPDQQRLAKKIAPLRKDGHLLLITLLIANMVANETLPVVSDNVLGGGIQAVVVSTVLVIIFSEIIPQSVCSTYGLQIGAACAKPVQLLVYLLYPICWPIAWLLTKILGPHSGVIYRRAELKELVNLHASQGHHGGDLNQDVVTIVGAAIDLQERVVRDSMTALDHCFMLNVDTQLDYETLVAVLESGHSRIPVYEDTLDQNGVTRRKILGALLTKQLILIDPEDGVPLRDFPLNPLPVVADNMPLLNILNSFQEGRSHLAIVCPRQAKVAFAPLPATTPMNESNIEPTNDSNIDIKSEADPTEKKSFFRFFQRKTKKSPEHEFKVEEPLSNTMSEKNTSTTQVNHPSFWPLLTDQPVGIITLEDVLEELLGEQIYDETDHDERGNMAVHPYVPPEAAEAMRKSSSRTELPPIPIKNKRWSLSTFRSSSMTKSRNQQPKQSIEDELLHGNYEEVATPTDDEHNPAMDMTHDIKDKNCDKPLVSHHEHVDLRQTNSACPPSIISTTSHAFPQSISSLYPPTNSIGPKIDLGIQPRSMKSSVNGGGTNTTFSDAISLERGRRAVAVARGAVPGILSHPPNTRTGSFKGPASSSLLKVSKRISKEKESRLDDKEDGKEDQKEDGKEEDDGKEEGKEARDGQESILKNENQDSNQEPK
ncbi:uncharacterized protein MELLADRAFT_118502 [Melampsora larici-populina 98AG31]|uniref:CNNM transmembrane domain-containing protein n=1 Tax=Melampsora larici-populina (strain 98AG31 / pathotype 3-4-7) TaxID=747676 RepID=F4S9U2_MELLP|nr:uncharacterized protein MELLADRAFT_118502 [Melampsora larici-populina 98AG31]EGF98601.1 hypothetical protein MELLADRAFT_118502 [Melampsora larici-populina 98AG31]